MLRKLYGIPLAIAIMFGPTYFAGCDVNEGPAEQAGENMDEGMEDIGEGVEEATEVD